MIINTSEHMPAGQILDFAPADPAPADGDKQKTMAEPLDGEHEEAEPNAEGDSGETAVPHISECVFVVFHAKPKAGSPSKQPAYPSEFKSREAYVELYNQGFTEIPPAPSCGLFYHKSSAQWHSRFGHDGEMNRAPTWGLLRSEKKAILLAMEAMWAWYVANGPNSTKGLDEKYLKGIRNKLETLNF